MRRITLKKIRWMCLAAMLMMFLLSTKIDISSCPVSHFASFMPAELKTVAKIAADLRPTKPPFQKTFGIPASTQPDVNLHIVKSKDTPSFYVVTQGDRFPEANGDLAQQTVIDRIGLREKCQNDSSTIVVDIGGFLGDFGLRAAAMGCTVYIVEPTPFQYWLIKSSIALNGFEGRCFAYNYAISDKEDILKFSVSGGQTTQVPILPTDDVHNPELNTYFIHSIPLDKILPTEKIFLMKVDVEGFEPTVLFKGCKNIMEQHRVKHLITEYTPWWSENGQGPWDDFLHRLRGLAGARAKMFALHRLHSAVYGPIEDLEQFHLRHLGRKLQTDVYVDYAGTFTSDGLWQPDSMA